MEREEELMALYGIAKDEIEGVAEACERLEKAIQKLERVDSTIGMYAHRGIEECLRDFKSKYSITLCQEIKDVSREPQRGCYGCENRAWKTRKAVLGDFFFAGMLMGGFGLWWWASERFHDMEVGQRVLYNKIDSLKHPVKPQKSQVKHRRTEPTQSDEATNDGDSSAGVR